MKKLIFTISLLVFAAGSIVAQNTEQLKLATQVYEILKEKGENHIFEGDEAVLFKNLVDECHKDTLADMEKEAEKIGMDLLSYVESANSMEKFNQKLAEHADNLHNLSIPQILWIMFKSAQRVQIQAGGRYPAENFDENIKIAQGHLYKIDQKLKSLLN